MTPAAIRANGAEMAKLIAERRPGYSLAQPFYVDAEIFRLDIERIYRRHWLLAGPSCRVSRPGDYFTYQIANDSIVVVRDLGGEVRAFHNVCRHRGSLVCLEETGRAKRLVCPYHAWTYDLDGSLRSARHLPEGANATELGLHPVAVQVVAGLIFICLSERPPEFSETAADIEQFFSPYRLEQTTICRRSVEIIQANWKVTVENFWECHHCAPAHPEFCSVMSYAHAQNNERLAAERAQFERDWEAEMQRTGRPSGKVSRSAGGLHQGGRVPIRPGYATQSRDGRPVAPLLGSLREHDGGITSFMHLPLIWYVVASDYAFLTRFTPRSVLETELEMIWLVREDAVEGRDYDPEAVCWLWRETTAQDKTICENNQRGILSSRYRPGPYATTERAVDEFVAWYLRELAKERFG